jgi:CRP-like cAMP-binding protein
VFSAVVGHYEPSFLAGRLLRVGHLVSYFLAWERVSSLKPSIIRIVKSIFVVIFLAHFIGCIFQLIILLEGDAAKPAFTGSVGILEKSLPSRYIRSFYWSFVTMTGYNNTDPQTQTETIFSIFVTLIGISLFATIIGTVGSLVTNLDSSKLYFRQKMDGINDYMRYKKIPAELQEEVRSYFMYLWKSGKGLDKNKVLDDLPPYLKNKMSTFLNSELIKKVPLFASSKDDTEFITEVVKCLRSRICLPNSFVVRKGEIGTEMYFVSRGELNVINDQHMVVATLKDGTFFGEIAIMYDTKRTASIVARTYCDMFVLTKDDFKKVLRKFPTSSREVQEIAKTRYQQTSSQKTAEATGKSSAESDEDDDDRDNLEAQLPAARRASHDSDADSEELASVAPQPADT